MNSIEESVHNMLYLLSLHDIEFITELFRYVFIDYVPIYE